MRLTEIIIAIVMVAFYAVYDFFIVKPKKDKERKKTELYRKHIIHKYLNNPLDNQHLIDIHPEYFPEEKLINDISTLHEMLENFEIDEEEFDKRMKVLINKIDVSDVYDKTK